MRIAYLIIITLHALIHLLGFVKGLGLKDVKALTLPISKPMGVLWLAACAALITYAIAFISNHKQAWLAGMIAAVLSQLMIFIFWKDAKAGTIPNLLILIISFIGYGSFIIRSEFTRSVNSELSASTLPAENISEKDMAHLPPIVQKYLHYTGSVGKPKVQNFKAVFTGGMRAKPSDEYMPFESVQYNFYNDPSRYFFMEAKKMGMPATGLHIYRHGTASFRVKMLNWFTIIDAKGEKLDQAETVTLFNDMCCIAPPTLIDRRISWESITDTTVKGIFKNNNITISATLYFDSKGELKNFISNDRYETDGKKYSSYPWATPIESYKMTNGYLLPGKAKLIYHKPEGDFTYGELEYKSVEFNSVTTVN